MPPIQRKVVPTKKVTPTAVEPEDEEDEIEEDDIEETEQDDVAVEDTDAEDETEEDAEGESDEEVEYVGLPDLTEPIGEPNGGFDYQDFVHTSLKAAGYVTNKAQTKELIKFFNQAMFFNAFENGRHDIDGLGTVFSDIKPEKTMISTGFGGKEKGEEYTVAAKHFFGFKMSGKAKTKLAEISELDGWSPEEVLALIAEGVEEDAE